MPSAKQRAAQKAWVARQRIKEQPDAATRSPSVFETLVADIKAGQGVIFPAGFVYPPAADGHIYGAIVIDADGRRLELIDGTWVER